jgi:hypothetical protein
MEVDILALLGIELLLVDTRKCNSRWNIVVCLHGITCVFLSLLLISLLFDFYILIVITLIFALVFIIGVVAKTMTCTLLLACLARLASLLLASLFGCFADLGCWCNIIFIIRSCK